MSGGIPSRPEQQNESRSFCRLPRGKEAPPRASRPPSAASPRGLHGRGDAAGAPDARAGGGEAAAGQQGRCLQPTSELSSGQPPRALPKPAPQAPASGSRPRCGAHPRLEPACRPRAPGSGPGRHLPGLEATSSSSQTLPTVTCTAGPGAAPLLQGFQSAERGRRVGTKDGQHRQLPGRRPGGTPASLGVGAAGAGGGGAARSPTSAQPRAPRLNPSRAQPGLVRPASRLSAPSPLLTRLRLFLSV